uniref:Uncharacterized protein n=1 Tax=Fagus sylvatica TaxID=28930 RepID=A0A2N9J0B4_FAGSY
MMYNYFLCIPKISSSSSPKLNPYPLRESRKTAHRVDSPPATGVFHESRGPSPCTSRSTTNQTSTGLPGEGLLMHHVSSDPTIPGRPRAINRRYKRPFSLLSSATSVGAVCGKRVTTFTAPIRKDCMVRTRSMEVNAQLLPSSSQSPEMAAMEKQVRDLTANLQELTRQNQTLNQKLQQHETEKEKQRDKGKSKEKGDAESRQEQQQEQQQEHHQEQEDETKGENTRMPYEESTAKWEQEIKAMKAQLGEMKDEFKGRATRNLDTLVHRTDSPFTEKVISFPLPSKFRMPSLENFDGTKDPLDHLESFKTMMCLQGVPDEIMCRAFPTTLKGPARIWFKKLIPEVCGILRSAKPFILQSLYWWTTMWKTYHAPFKYDKVVLTAFISGLQSGDFLFSVYKDPPTSMSEMMYEAQRYMNGEEALQARDTGKKRRNDYADRPNETLESKPKMQRNQGKKREDRNRRGSNERFNHFTPLNAPVDRIFMQIKDDPALRWPGKLLTNPDRRAKDKYCRFHRDHGHNTEDCYDLKRQIEELIKQGKLQRFVERDQREGRPPQARPQRPPVEDHPRPPMGEIHMINGGMAAGGTSRSSRKAYARQIHNVLVVHPHDDALVVTLEIAGYSTRRVLIDNGSSADIIYLTAFQQMRIGKDQLRPIETPLVGFAGTSVYPLGIISLQIIAGTYPKQATKRVEFLVVDCPSAYNVIIGRPTLNRLRAVTSTYHLLVRFPTEHGIGEMKGDQAMARECYLNFCNEKRKTRIGTTMPAEIRDSIVQFLRENADVFAWSHEDMPGISTEVMVHKLNVNPSMHPIKQKRRVFAPERNAAVMAGDSTAGHKLLSFMDAFSGYNQIRMEEEDQEKTAFITSRGLFCYKVMPFGLKNAGATYQRLVNKMFHDQIGRNVEVYVDDMLVKSKENEDHPHRFERDLPGPEDLQHEVEPRKVCPLVYPRGKAAALNRFVSRSTDKCLPFFKILRKAFQWTEECQRAFEGTEGIFVFSTTSQPLKNGRRVISIPGRLIICDFIAEFTHPWEEEGEPEQLEIWTVNIDGSSTKEMGGAGIILVSPEKDKFEYAIQLRFRATNNEAEYEALLAGLKLSKKMGVKNLTVKSDSQLTLLPHFKKVEFVQIPREENVDADRLARLASSGEECDGFLEIQGRPSIEEETVNSIKDNVSWMSPIVRYLKEGRLPTDKTEARKLRIRASHFQLLDGILYKMGFSRPHLRCLSPEEANYVIREVHEGICGNHSGAQALGTQTHKGGAPPEEITPMTSPWPFAQWGLDIMGPFPVGTKQAKFLVVAIDYFTKWVEAEPLGDESPRKMSRTSSGRASFVDSEFRESWFRTTEDNLTTDLSENYVIKTRLEGAKGMWVEELPSILWAYRTTVRTPTGKTPFKLTFGTEAVIPVEIGLTTLRTTFHKEEENEGQLRLNLDLLDKTRDKAACRITLYQEKMAKYYNTKVKLRRFEIGDWVLRKVTQATKDPSQGKLGPNWEGPYKVIQYYRRGTYHLEDRHGKKASPSLEC